MQHAFVLAIRVLSKQMNDVIYNTLQDYNMICMVLHGFDAFSHELNMFFFQRGPRTEPIDQQTDGHADGRTDRQTDRQTRNLDDTQIDNGHLLSHRIHVWHIC